METVENELVGSVYGLCVVAPAYETEVEDIIILD